MRQLKGERPPCPRCGNPHIIKSGILSGKQRFLCRQCQYQFTQAKMRAKPGNVKAIALTLYSYGLTLAMIARLLNTSVPAIHNWIRDFLDQKIQKPDSAQLVTMPLSELTRILPNMGSCQNKPVVLVPVDDRTGEIAGMISIPAENLPAPAKESV